MVRQSLIVLLLIVLTVSLTSGWLFGRRRRTTIVHNTNVNTNNCNCNKVVLALMARIEKLEKKLARRDVADLLELEEDSPGLDNLLDHLDTKRDGSVDKRELMSVLKRASTASLVKMVNSCKCARSVVDSFNLGLL